MRVPVFFTYPRLKMVFGPDRVKIFEGLGRYYGGEDVYFSSSGSKPASKINHEKILNTAHHAIQLEVFRTILDRTLKESKEENIPNQKF